MLRNYDGGIGMPPYGLTHHLICSPADNTLHSQPDALIITVKENMLPPIAMGR
jgi:hypothetical protein